MCTATSSAGTTSKGRKAPAACRAPPRSSRPCAPSIPARSCWWTPATHDLACGAALRLQASNAATYRYVSANIVRGRGGDTLVFPAVTVVTRNGVKIAFTGLTTPGVMVWDQAQLSAARIRVRSLAAAAPQAPSALAAAGADFT